MKKKKNPTKTGHVILHDPAVSFPGIYGTEMSA